MFKSVILTAGGILVFSLAFGQNIQSTTNINYPKQAGLTKEFTGKIEYAIQHNGDFFFTINDPKNGRADIFITNGSCSSESSTIQYPDESKQLIEKFSSGERFEGLVFRISAFSSNGRHCLTNKTISVPIWRITNIRQISSSDVNNKDLQKSDLIGDELIGVVDQDGIKDEGIVAPYNVSWSQVNTFLIIGETASQIVKQNEVEIEKVKYEMDKIFGLDENANPKSAFETTQEYSSRIYTFLQKKRSYEEANLFPLLLKRNNYQFLFERKNLIKLSVGVDQNEYDADNQLWAIGFTDEDNNVKLNLTIPPLQAKQLWDTKGSWTFYELSKISMDKAEYVEWIVPAHGMQSEFSLLLKREARFRTLSDILKSESTDDDDKVYEKVEVDADFPGGSAGWTRYVTREIERNIDELRDDGRSGTVVVQFIVDKEGAVSDVRALPCNEAGVKKCLPPDSKLAEIAINTIRKGPKWTPAVQNGRKVKAFRRQPVSLNLAEE